MTDTPQVFAAIVSVMKEIGSTGISKARKNEQQGYKFRGIDDVYNELNGILSKNNLVMLPRVTAREQVERQTAKGTPLFFTNVAVDFTLVSAVDGSQTIISTVGEAMDSGDKSSNKALSAAYKYAAMMVFCIPTEGDNDADAVTHDVAPARQPLKAVDGQPAASKAQARGPYDTILKGVQQIEREGGHDDLTKWYRTHAATIEKFPADWHGSIMASFTEARETIAARVGPAPTKEGKAA